MFDMSGAGRAHIVPIFDYIAKISPSKHILLGLVEFEGKM